MEEAENSLFFDKELHLERAHYPPPTFLNKFRLQMIPHFQHTNHHAEL